MSEEIIMKHLSACESLVMKAIWDAKHDISLRELIDTLRNRYEKDYARTTVTTFLKHLSDKGYVKTYRIGRTSYTHALVDEDDYKQKMLQEEKMFWFQGNASKLMSALIRGKKLSKNERDKIREMLDELDD